MLRLLGFFAGAMALMYVLRLLPVVGGLFHGFLGFWLTAILVSVIAERLSRSFTERRRAEATARSLGHVESAHNQGKLGSLLLAGGNARRALPHLERACAGEPDVPEWHYRHGLALERAGRPAEAAAALGKAAALNPEHAYGDVQLALARVHLAGGHSSAALSALELFERNHGPTPESAYHRGLALRAGGRKEPARAAFGEVGELAARTAGFQRRTQRGWVLKAWLARLV